MWRPLGPLEALGTLSSFIHDPAHVTTCTCILGLRNKKMVSAPLQKVPTGSLSLSPKAAMGGGCRSQIAGKQEKPMDSDSTIPLCPGAYVPHGSAGLPAPGRRQCVAFMTMLNQLVISH